MGRATRWIKSLLTGRRDDRPTAAPAAALPREKKRWSFTRSPKEQPAVDPAWLRSLYADAGREHAIAVAAAQAPDAAVAAALAAVAVARLSRHGERRAAVRIQTAFRAFLARKALRALRALVKLQALVRGYLVRKRAAATLHSMQALVRALATVRTYQQSRGALLRRSLERWDEARSEQGSRRVSGTLDGLLPEGSPKIVEVDPGRPRSRGGGGGGRTAGDETHSSPLARLSVLKAAHDREWYLAGDECGGGFSTAQSTPRFHGGKVAGNRYHNYMANTQSFRAKVRSQSAPKQRPEPWRRMSLSEMAESRASLSGVRMQKTCSRAQEVAAFDRSCDLNRHYDYYLQRRW